jgi:HPt (histidine-containing phosphotransfer) domain-containing protein
MVVMDSLFSELSHIEGIDAWEALSRVGNNPDFLYSTLRSFCGDFENHISELRNALAGEDWKNYTIHIHAFKGALGNIGAEDLRARAYDLEMASRAGDYDKCRAENPGMEQDLSALRDSLLQTSLMTEKQN